MTQTSEVFRPNEEYQRAYNSWRQKARQRALRRLSNANETEFHRFLYEEMAGLVEERPIPPRRRARNSNDNAA